MLRLLLMLWSALVASATASAQPVLQNLASGALTTVRADDSGEVTSQGTDLVTYFYSSSDAGHVSQPYGSGSTFIYQDCSGSAALDASVAGAAAPYLQTSANMTGTQNGVIPSTVFCTSAANGSFTFEFGFHSPTFGTIVGGDALPIAFHLDGELDASSICTSGQFCAYSSNASIQIERRPGSPAVIALVSASSSGPTTNTLNFDFVADLSLALVVKLSTSSSAATAEPLTGQTGIGSSTANVDGVQLTVDFTATEAAIKLADPSLPQATIDAGLADLEVLVSPGVDLPSFAPQFPQTQATPVPAVSRPGLAVLILLLAAVVWSYHRSSQAALARP